MSEQQIHINGTTLLYRDRGRGDPIVLVHGNISDMRSWEPLEPHLCTRFRVINYSRRFAYPNAPIKDGEDDVLTRHADDLETLIKELRLGRVHLVGNSSGAFICLLLAQRRPDMIRTLTLEEPPVLSLFLRTLPPPFSDLIRLLFSSPLTLIDLVRFGAGTIEQAVKSFKAGEDDRAVEIFARGVLGSDSYRKLTRVRKQQMRDNFKPHRAALLGSGLPTFTQQDAESLKVPTMLLCGSRSPRFQQRINRKLASLIPGARHEMVVCASHFLHEDRPQSVAKAVISFCIENK